MITTSINLSENGKISVDITPALFPPKTIRTAKGKSMIVFPNSYCIVDIETTGLSPSYDSIIEIAAIKVENEKICDTFSSLLQPDTKYADGSYIDDFITELTGITNEMLDSAPKSQEVISKFKNFIGDSIIIGHNVHFDINFLYDNFINYLSEPLSNDFVDTMRISRKLHSNLPHHRLSDIAQLYNIEYTCSHRALNDCEITHECYIKLKEEIINHYESIEYFTKHFRSSLKAKDIETTSDQIDESNTLYGKVVVFTGTLEKMIRKDAMQIVANLGGINADNVTAKTNYLVLGNNDYCSTLKDGKSNKHKKAESLKLKGQDIEIIPENVFYDMIADFIQNNEDTNNE